MVLSLNVGIKQLLMSRHCEWAKLRPDKVVNVHKPNREIWNNTNEFIFQIVKQRNVLILDMAKNHFMLLFWENNEQDFKLTNNKVIYFSHNFFRNFSLIWQHKIQLQHHNWIMCWIILQKCWQSRLYILWWLYLKSEADTICKHFYLMRQK